MKHPKGLYLLFATEMAERFSYYGMRSLFTLYIVAAFFSKEFASEIYGSYTGLVYLTPLVGGYVADRFWGNRRSIIVGGLTMAVGQFLLFLSACFVNEAYNVELGGIDSGVDNSLAITLLFAGIAVLVVGNGFFKPNISTMVGDLYDPQDRRKDAAFTIFYMGINIGGFAAPLWCGFVGEGSATDLSPFKWGFLSACVAMLVSVAIFHFLKDKYLITPEGKKIGVAPKENQVVEPKKSTTDNVVARKNSPWRMWSCAVGAIVLFLVFAVDSTKFTDYISAAIYAVSIAMPVFIITDRTLSRGDKERIGVIYIIAVFVIFFWAAFEQAGITLTFFAAEEMDRTVLGWDVPASWFQSFNPIFVIILAPPMAAFWQLLSRRNREPMSPAKQAMGLMLLALGYLVMAEGVRGMEPGVKVSMFWLAALYFLHTVGELTLSPIGLSMVNKLAPRHLASLLMGVWFMSNAASNILAGKLATFYPGEGSAPKSILGYEVATMDDFFMVFVVMAATASLLLFALCPLLKRMMHGVE